MPQLSKDGKKLSFKQFGFRDENGNFTFSLTCNLTKFSDIIDVETTKSTTMTTTSDETTTLTTTTAPSSTTSTTTTTENSGNQKIRNLINFYLDQQNTLLNTTVSGRTCQNWSSMSPHFHAYDHVGNHNFCSNPTNIIGGNWCYTTDPNVRWEFCVNGSDFLFGKF